MIVCSPSKQLILNGDGLDRTINQKLFPDGCHFDPDTRIWCVSIAIRDLNINLIDTCVFTYVCKLPEHTRRLPIPYWRNGEYCWYTSAYHLKETKVPHCNKAHNILHPGVKFSIVEIPDYEEFLTKVVNVIDNITSHSDPVYKLPIQPIISKGYGNYNYDYIALKNACNKYGIKFDGSSMISLSNVPNLNSSKQVSAGHNIPNQQYLLNGIRHNIDDTLLLNNYIYDNIDLSIKQINNKIRQQQMNQDFANTDTLRQS